MEVIIIYERRKRNGNDGDVPEGERPLGSIFCETREQRSERRQCPRYLKHRECFSP